MVETSHSGPIPLSPADRAAARQAATWMTVVAGFHVATSMLMSTCGGFSALSVGPVFASTAFGGLLQGVHALIFALSSALAVAGGAALFRARSAATRIARGGGDDRGWLIQAVRRLSVYLAVELAFFALSSLGVLLGSVVTALTPDTVDGAAAGLVLDLARRLAEGS